MSKLEFVLASKDAGRFQRLSGYMNENFRVIETALSVSIANRGELVSIEGEETAILQARQVIDTLYAQTENAAINIDAAAIHLVIRDIANTVSHEVVDDEIIIQTKRGKVRGRGTNQRQYLKRIFDYDVNFGLGPAGTGKTYLAVACAVAMLNEDLVRRIVLVRPAVEAGERLGFLPGDLAQKVDPYLRPLYDALYEMLGAERAGKLIEKNIIEIAPLAFMRGRTLSDAFIILDEAQNTTAEQMKMFLTRIGFGSKAVVTGDLSQVDLPKGVRSGLRDASEVLKGVEGIAYTVFSADDVVRHPLVQRIVIAYEKQAASQSNDAKR
ncbi:PhoH family protein [Ostreibacterium oceani]|uniref:PhoH-like protein n=1 Tax=Ostreibacterium oceani TaxID=2654998 RepID=A0A6N7EUU6_9GAMM|nr:PhoH family protein [Ostreibacterium oceani]MPV86554.1 AAA family ATPase [Ostreibacterium oceani]